jgi:DNA-binding XRE family transcriptional regulator
MLITEICGDQIKRSRELLDLTQRELARRAGINRISLRIYESWGPEPVSAQTLVLGKLLRFLEGEGVVFEADGTVTLKPVSRTMKAQVAREAAVP